MTPLNMGARYIVDTPADLPTTSPIGMLALVLTPLALYSFTTSGWQVLSAASAPPVSTPASESALGAVELATEVVHREGGHDRLQWAAIGQEGHHRQNQLLWLVHPVESGALGGREGPATALAAVALLFLAVDHDVAFAGAAVGTAMLVMTELLVRVHADAPLSGDQRPNKGAAVPACNSTHANPRFHEALPRACRSPA